MTHTIDKLLTHADEQMAVLDMVRCDLNVRVWHGFVRAV